MTPDAPVCPAGGAAPTLFAVSQGPDHRFTGEVLKFLPTPRPAAKIDTGVSHGAEIAGTVLVFFLIGLGLDSWWGTTPVFMIALSVFAVTGQFVRTWFVYNQEMERHEAERAASREGRSR